MSRLLREVLSPAKVVRGYLTSKHYQTDYGAIFTAISKFDFIENKSEEEDVFVQTFMAIPVKYKLLMFQMFERQFNYFADSEFSNVQVNIKDHSDYAVLNVILRMASTYNISLVLFDIVMPGCDYLPSMNSFNYLLDNVHQNGHHIAYSHMIKLMHKIEQSSL